MKNKTNLSYKLIIIFIILIVILIFGSVFAMHILLKDIESGSKIYDEDYTKHFAFIGPEEDEDFWDNVYAGALSAGNENGIYVENFGADLTVDYDKDQLLQIAIDADVDGIIIDGDSSKTTIDLIDQAAEEGIPVVTVMDDSSDSKRICFVGISSYALGRQYGEEIISSINKDADSPINVEVLIDSVRDNSSQDLVISGITDIFSEKGFDARLNIEGKYIDNTSTFGAEEDIRDIFLNDKLPDVIIALNSVYTRCLFQAAVDYNKVGEVKIYGFHDSDDILDAVSKDVISATISVNTADMGGACVEALVEYLETGYVSTYLAQDTKIILNNEATRLLNEEDEE